MKLFFSMLMASLAFFSCGSDDEAPEIKIISPIAGENIGGADSVSVILDLSDNDELASVTLQITNEDNSQLYNGTFELEGQTYQFMQNIPLTDGAGEKLLMLITLTDVSLNSRLGSVELTRIPALNINFQLTYDDEPLQMFSDYQYPLTDEAMNFTRFSMYISEMKLDDTQIVDLDFLNMTEDHVAPPSSSTGYDYSISTIPFGTYEKLSFQIGIPAELNAMSPSDFPSGHPLARSAEHWFSWASYIFAKIEGNIDLDGDGTKETAIALHIGSDETLMQIDLDANVEIRAGETTDIAIEIDLYDVLMQGGEAYDIASNPQLHSLSQLEFAKIIRDNIILSIQSNN